MERMKRKNAKVVRMLWLFCIVAITGLAGCDYGYDDWDASGDDLIDENEFNEGFANTNYYGGWDADDDDLINDEEFYDGTFGIFDTDNDNYLTENEWSVLGDNFEDYDFGEYDSWDADNDGLLQDDEYAENIGNTGLYDTWDADNDNFLNEDEFTGGIFDTWDVNDNDMIDEDEYARWEENMNVSS